MLIVISKHYTAARQIWVRRGKKKKRFLFCQKAFLWTVSWCLCCPSECLSASWVPTFWLAAPCQKISPSKFLTQILEHFREEREELVRQAVWICEGWWVPQVFTFVRSSLILLTPETQIRIWPAIAKCSCGYSSPTEANRVCFLITIFTLTNLFNRASMFQAGLGHTNNQLTEPKRRNAGWIIAKSAFMLLLMYATKAWVL